MVSGVEVNKVIPEVWRQPRVSFGVQVQRGAPAQHVSARSCWLIAVETKRTHVQELLANDSEETNTAVTLLAVVVTTEEVPAYAITVNDRAAKSMFKDTFGRRRSKVEGVIAWDCCDV